LVKVKFAITQSETALAHQIGLTVPPVNCPELPPLGYILARWQTSVRCVNAYLHLSYQLLTCKYVIAHSHTLALCCGLVIIPFTFLVIKMFTFKLSQLADVFPGVAVIMMV
jgi:hypothetical protein